MLKKAVALFLVCAGLALFVSCGKSLNHFVYAAIPTSSQILVFREDPNSGALTPLASSPFSAGQGVQSLALHPSGKFLYAANSSQDNISLFTIASTGAITEITTTPAGTTPAVLVMDPTGSYLYVINAESQDLWVYSISTSSSSLGVLSTVGAPTSLGFTPLNMALSPSGNFLYVTGTAQQGYIEVFSLSAGVLTLAQVVQTGRDPVALAIDPGGSYLYTGNFSDNSISEFSIDSSSGQLSPLAGSPIGITYTSPNSLFVEKSGKYLYVANEGSTYVTSYSIGSDGGLSLLATSPFATGQQPSLVAGDPNGLYLFVGNQKSPAIESLALSGGGSLVAVGTYPIANTPTSIVVLP